MDGPVLNTPRNGHACEKFYVGNKVYLAVMGGGVELGWESLPGHSDSMEVIQYDPVNLANGQWTAGK